MSEESKGQQIRKNIRLGIEQALSGYCPNTISRMANLIAYDFNLSPDTLRYNYLPMFIDAGILELDQDNLYTLSEKGKRLQRLKATESGITGDQLQKEIDKENEKRSQLGKPGISLEEWKKMRSKRLKLAEP